MKNLKVSMKLIVSFLIVIVLAVTVGVIGIIGMNSINNADDDLYNYNLIAVDSLGSIRENFTAQRNITRSFVLYDGGSDKYRSALSDLEKLEASMDEYVAKYTPTMNTKEDEDTFNKFLSIYHDDYSKLKADLKTLGSQNRSEEALELIETTGTTVSEEINEILTQAYTFNVDIAKEAVDNNTKLFTTMTILEIIILLAAVIVSLFLALYISRLISKPLSLVSQFLQRFGKEGNLVMTDEDREGYANRSKDEIGDCQESLNLVANRLMEVKDTLGKVAAGDLTVDINLLSEKDDIGIAISKLLENLNQMFTEINASSSQVSIGANQVANGSQSLAQGSTEQASSVQELSASISEVADKTKQNATMAGEAAELSNDIKANAESGNQQMDQLMTAVTEINEASQSISKVIKVIDDIAFQTNILALNAAVEAARAGQHGKGFAVVAEEVRNLASKSAEAAKDTGSMIENSIERANLGLSIATQTSASLKDIVDGINRSAEIVERISQSSNEQAMAISQINVGVDQVSQVVQQNSATAEESAAASEEMSGQSSLLQDLISRFKLKNSKSFTHAQPTFSTNEKQSASPASSASSSSYAGGKY